MQFKQIFGSTKFQILLIFIISFGFFLFFQFQIPDFLGRDAYYHLKMAKFASEGKIAFDQFPWLWFTTLREQFVDQHFLFHLLLAPFLIFGNFISPFIKRGGVEGGFLGAKIATAIFSSFVILVFYLILQKNKVFAAFFWAILLLGASLGFLFRMNLMQAQGLALFWFFFGIFGFNAKKIFLAFSYFFSLFLDSWRIYFDFGDGGNLVSK